MKKQLTAWLIALVMLFSLVGCGADAPVQDDSSLPQQEQQDAQNAPSEDAHAGRNSADRRGRLLHDQGRRRALYPHLRTFTGQLHHQERCPGPRLAGRVA